MRLSDVVVICVLICFGNSDYQVIALQPFVPVQQQQSLVPAVVEVEQLLPVNPPAVSQVISYRQPVPINPSVPANPQLLQRIVTYRQAGPINPVVAVEPPVVPLAKPYVAPFGEGGFVPNLGYPIYTDGTYRYYRIPFVEAPARVQFPAFGQGPLPIAARGPFSVVVPGPFPPVASGPFPSVWPGFAEPWATSGLAAAVWPVKKGAKKD